MALGGERRSRHFRLAPPIQLDSTLRSIHLAELLAYLGILTRMGARTIRYAARNVPDAVQVLQFVTNYRLDLDP